MVITYQCPNCGAAMAFDGKTGKLYCENCRTLLTVEEYERDRKAEGQQAYQQTAYGQTAYEQTAYEQTAYEQTAYEQEEADSDTISMHMYHCPSCGAELMTDENTAALICTFCGNPGLISDRMSGVRKPKSVIPFRITKDQAVERFRKWTKGGLLTPGSFTSEQTIEKITGMYVPYWLFDYHVNVEMHARGTRSYAARRGNTEYIYTDHYAIYRDMHTDFEKAPADASRGMDDAVMESIEPYDYGELREFDMGYLSGYLAEKYNMPSDQVEPRVRGRIQSAAVGMTRNTINKYETVTVTDSQVSFRKKKVEYAMMPVWVLNYRYHDKNYSFTLNGQTGKINGKLPISAGKIAMWFGLITAGSFVVSMAVTILRGLL